MKSGGFKSKRRMMITEGAIGVAGVSAQDFKFETQNRQDTGIKSSA
jgi:hypothetical protein